MPYSKGFKMSMVQKLTTPGGPSATQLSREVGVPQSTLSRWVRMAGRVGNGAAPPDPLKGPMEAKRPQDWSAEEKLQVVIGAAALPDGELGEFLRRQGLHEAQLQEWRQRVLTGLEQQSTRSSNKHTAEARRVRELERELARKDKALAETAALLVLQKKARAIWGDEDDDTGPKSGRVS
jgi:transposase